MRRYLISNKIFNMKMKIYKPLHSYPNLTYYWWVLSRWETHAKVELTNPFGSTGHQADRAGGMMDPIIRVYQIGLEGPLSLVATLLGQGHSEIKPTVDDTLEAVVKASHIREQIRIKNLGPSG